MNTQTFGQTGQMIELSCEYFSLQCIWLFVLIMTVMRFKVNQHYLVAWMSRNSLLEEGVRSEVYVTAMRLKHTTKLTLNCLAKLAKWLSCVMSTYHSDAFDCMFLSCHVCISEWIHTLLLHDSQGTPCSKTGAESEV